MIHIILGTRAQLIKMAPVMIELNKRDIDYNFIFLSQHKETVFEMLDEFKLKRPDQILCDNEKDIVSTIKMFVWSLKVLIKGFINKKKIFLNDKSGIALVHGDAPPLLLGSLLAKSQGIKVGQVEAGLRSYNIFKPFPEELTRVLTARLWLINYYFCQDNNSYNVASKYPGQAVETSGNTLIDTIKMCRQEDINIKEEFGLGYSKFALVTIHRYENLKNIWRFELILNTIQQASQRIPIIFILHPPTRKVLNDKGYIVELQKNKNIALLPRQSFFRFHQLLHQAEFIISDGGSNQEETAYLGKPCLLMRSETERREGIGENVVLSYFDEKIISHFIKNYTMFTGKTSIKNLNPSNVIVNFILSIIQK